MHLREVRREPGDARERSAAVAGRSSGPNRTRVGVRVAHPLKSSLVSACSAIFPAYMTITRSVRPAITPMSWVMSRLPCSAAGAGSSIRSRIWAWIVTSRAVVGSSAIRSLGSQASAMAIMTRWRSPPDSSWGYWSSRSAGRGMSTRPRTSRARSGLWLLDVPVQADRLDDLAADRLGRVERGHRVLGDKRHFVAPHPSHLPLVQGRQVPAVQQDPAGHHPAVGG